jgi:hypothetical protein
MQLAIGCRWEAQGREAGVLQAALELGSAGDADVKVRSPSCFGSVYFVHKGLGDACREADVPQVGPGWVDAGITVVQSSS